MSVLRDAIHGLENGDVAFYKVEWDGVIHEVRMKRTNDRSWLMSCACIESAPSCPDLLPIAEGQVDCMRCIGWKRRP